MIVEASVTMKGSRAAAWAAITDIENAAAALSGVERIDIVEKPLAGIVGLRWRETRILFGEPATVEKKITDAVENEFYRTKAESDGFLFLTTMRLSESADGITVTSAHETKPQGLLASLKALPMVFFKGVVKKAILQDLNDLKAVVEQPSSAAVHRGRS